MINKVLNYIRQRPQWKKYEPHHYLQPPTRCQFCLESANVRSSCDEQPAVKRTLAYPQHLHSVDTNTFVQPSRLGKRTRVYRVQIQWASRLFFLAIATNSDAQFVAMVARQKNSSCVANMWCVDEEMAWENMSREVTWSSAAAWSH